jgi:ribose transport system permease protein
VADEELLAGPGRAAGEALKTGSSATEVIPPDPSRGEQRKRPAVPETAALFMVLVALSVFFAITSKFFLNTDNLINILQNVARIGIIAGPATLLLISGQFDLSVGSVAAFSAMVMAVLAGDPAVNTKGFAFGLPLEVAFIGAMIASVLVGVLNAVSVTVFRINALITTLGTLAIFRGLTKVLGNGQTIVVDNFDPLGTTRIAGLPLPVYFFFGVSLVTYIVLRYTTYGRSMYAIGASPTAALASGPIGRSSSASS